MSFSDRAPDGVQLWRGSTGMTGWNTAMTVAHGIPGGNFLATQIKISKNGSFWNLEMKIPRDNTSTTAGDDNDIFFPATGTFRMYLNVITAIQLPSGNTYYQTP